MNGCCGKTISVRVRFFAYFRKVFEGKERTLDLDAGTKAGELLALLGDTPERRAELFESGGAVSPPVLKAKLIVMINGVDLASRGGAAAELREGDTVAIFPLMGGG
ncbi:MAG: MoaD/ThiS family protein [Candidatus Aminicenantes bacterium]|nr:MoaD/ThiS family protein [Candidatus Aminicenantes bacterium]